MSNQLDREWDGVMEEFDAAFSEPVLSKPATGSPRTITATITRNEGDKRLGHLVGVRSSVIIAVRNDPVLGVDIASLDVNSHRFNFAHRPNEAPRDWDIVQILNSDAHQIEMALQ